MNITSLSNLINQFEKMPGIGMKSASRIAFYILNLSKSEVDELAFAITDAKEKVRLCNVCQSLTDGDICHICCDNKRDDSIICVVESVKDMLAIERAREYRGLYHVLHGVISPINNIKAEDIKIKELIARINDKTKEIIIATNASIDGEATAIYLSRLINPLGITVSRIAYGIPIGADIEYTDEITIAKALEGRHII